MATRVDRIVVWAGLALLAAYSLRRPPVPRESDSPAGAAARFSLERAQAHVRAIASEPHPVGSPAHARVAAYVESQIRALGLDPQVQETTGISQQGRWTAAAAVRNIAVRIPGSASTGAVMLVAHYDSVPTGPGASDDGHGTAVVLEALRAIRAASSSPQPPPRNDLIFLFTDAEECGLLGAAAFERDNPLRSNVRVVVNFEARGTSDAPSMFETSDGNGWLISELARAVPGAVANSVAYEIYRRLPNDTDLTVFKKAGRAGLNFAFIGSPYFYHTPYDNPAHLDPRSLEADGVYAVGLARRLAASDLSRAVAPNSIYFATGFTPLVRYPAAWAQGLALAAVLLLGVSFAWAARRRRLSVLGVVLGVLAVPALVAAGFAACAGVWLAARWMHPQYDAAMYGFTYNGGLYFSAGLALAAAVFCAALDWLARAERRTGFAAGALLWPAALLMAAVAVAPGATYLLQWPLVFAAVAFAVMAAAGDDSAASGMRALGLALLAAPALILVAPLLQGGYVALGMRGAPALAAAFVLLLVLLLPQIAVAARGWWPTWIALLAAAVLFGAGAATSGFSAEHPKPNYAAYALDSGAGKAWWLGRPEISDPWMEQFFGRTPKRENVSDFLPSRGLLLFRAPAPVLADLPAPSVEVVSSAAEGDSRRMELRIRANRPAVRMLVTAEQGRFDTEAVNGVACGSAPPAPRASIANDASVLVWSGPGEAPLTLAIRTGAGERVVLRVVTSSLGLAATPGAALRPREAWMMDAGGWLNGTAVARTLALP